VVASDPHDPLVLRGHGLILRDWQDGDIPSMVRLFDEPTIDAWTPLASPFDRVEAGRYLARARAARANDQGIQLAITTDGVQPLGEVLLSYVAEGVGELAYAVGVEYRGNRLAARAVRLVIDYAATARSIGCYLLRIAAENAASQRVAAACGFRRTDEAPLVRQRKGRRVELLNWALVIDLAEGRPRRG